MAKITEIGKFLRRYRVDKNIKQKDMAKILDVSTAFLSYVETGVKQPPKVWRESVPQLLSLNRKLTVEFEKSFDLSSDILKRVETIVLKNSVRLSILEKLTDETLEDEIFENVLQILNA